jgi:hypothetical protein
MGSPQNKNNKTMETNITPDNIGKESYHNLVRLAEITGYANPIAALKATGETVTVAKDELGNII